MLELIGGGLVAVGSFIRLLEGGGDPTRGETQGPRGQRGDQPCIIFSPWLCFSFPGHGQSLTQPCPEGGGEEGCATGQEW